MGKSLGVDDARFPRPISRGCRGARDITALLMHFMFYAFYAPMSPQVFKCNRIQYSTANTIPFMYPHSVS